MPESTTTPDFSPSPRKRFEEVDLSGLGEDPIVPIVFLNPSVLYIQCTDDPDGTQTIDFTAWESDPVTDMPIFANGKFDLTLIQSIQAASGIEKIWRAW